MRADRLFRTMRACEKGVRWKASVQRFEIDTLRWAADIRGDVMGGRYRAKGFHRFDIVERGKPRHIQAMRIPGRVVEKQLNTYALKPVIYPRLIYDNSASQEGKGTEFALRRLVEHLRWHLARYGKRGAIVIMDYHAFFDSIPHAGAIAALSVNQPDERVRRYIADGVNAYDGDAGLGLGSEMSQTGAACYPTPIDKFVKEGLHVFCYARYNDDSYMILPTRAQAVRCLEAVRQKAAAYGLEIHPEKTRIHNLATDDFTFLKKRVHITDSGRIVLRLTRDNIRREEERICRHKEEYDAGRMPLSAILQSYQSWRSYAQKYNACAAVGRMDRYFTAVMGDVLGPERRGYGHPKRGDQREP